MKLIFSPLAAKQWEEWKKVDPATAKRIKRLLQDILEHPYSGIGKPEPLKFELAGKWSRRINGTDRIVYQVIGEMIEVEILSMKYHYTKK